MTPRPAPVDPLLLLLPEWAVPVAMLFVVLALAYTGMWFGWRRRSTKHVLPPLHAAPAEDRLPQPLLRARARYFGTTVSGDWLDRVVAHGLGARSTAGLSLSEEGLDVLRPSGSFRIPVAALRAARRDQGLAGKVVPPHGLLVVTWQHGDHALDTGFRLEPPTPDSGSAADTTTETHEAWVDTIGTLVREHKEHTA
jgi:hypothetical protein